MAGSWPLSCFNRIFDVWAVKEGAFGIWEPKTQTILTDDWKAPILTFFYCRFSLFLFVIVSFGGSKGQVRWPEGPPHLALNLLISLVVFFCSGVSFVLVSFRRHKNLWLYPRKGHFIYFFSVSHCFCLSFFAAPFRSLSLSISILLFCLFSFIFSFFLSLFFLLVFFFFSCLASRVSIS